MRWKVIGTLLLVGFVTGVEARPAALIVEVRSWACLRPDVVNRVRCRRAPSGGWRSRGHVVSDASVARLRAALQARPIGLGEFQAGIALNPASVRANAEEVARYLHDEAGPSDSVAQESAARLASDWAAAAVVLHLGGKAKGHLPCDLDRISFSTSGSSVRITLPGEPPLEAWASKDGELFLPWRVREAGLERETWSLDLVIAVHDVVVEAGMPLRGLDVALARRTAPTFPSGWQRMAHLYAKCVREAGARTEAPTR